MFETANTDTIRTRGPMMFLLTTAGQLVVTGAVVIATIVHVEQMPMVKSMMADSMPLVPVRPKPVEQRTATVRPAMLRTETGFVYRPPSPLALSNRQITILDDAPVTGFEGIAGAGLTSGPGFPGTGAEPIAVAPPKPPAPQPVKAAVVGPQRVGGDVQNARLVYQPKPVYPHLAKIGRISGRVRLDATISRDGVIQNLRVIDGHPLLVQAALDSVRQWRYKPTTLNGEVVEVLTQIEVNFTLSQ